MPRIKKEAHVKKFKVKKKQASDIDVDDRLAACARGDLDQIVRVGQLVESVLAGEFGGILRALLRGRQASELAESRHHGGTLTSDRYLGRLDAYERILEDLEQYVLDKDKAVEKIRDSQKIEREVSLAEEPGVEAMGPSY